VVTNTGRPLGSARRRTGVMLLLLPVLALACVPLYARDGPRLVDVPFFYWYQLAWVALSIVCMAGAALLIPTPPTRPTHPHRTAEPGGPQ
jgi:hypothetical protein